MYDCECGDNSIGSGVCNDTSKNKNCHGRCLISAMNTFIRCKKIFPQEDWSSEEGEGFGGGGITGYW